MSGATEKTDHLAHTEKIRCSFCKGMGKDPFDQLYPGSICQGRKEIYVLSPYKTCTYCHGSGVAFSSQNTCTVCHGRGVISHPARGHVCPECGGSGMDVETNLPCLACQGTGRQGIR